MHKKSLVLAISAICCGGALAQDSSELAVVDVVDSAFQDQIRSITTERLENTQATDIKGILQEMPSVIADGASRYSQKVYVRGLEDKFSNISIDGARMTGQLFHHSGDQTIDAEMLKIGEVELGANSALSGEGVINGAFVYETKDAQDLLKDGQTFGAKVSVGYETGFKRKKANLSLYAAPTDSVGILVSGNFVDDKEVDTPVDVDDSKQSRLKSGLVKVNLEPTGDLSFDVSYNVYQDGGNRQLSGNKADDERGNYTYNEINRETVTGRVNYNPSDAVDASLKVYHTQQRLERPAVVEANIARGSRTADGEKHQPNRIYENRSIGFDLRNTSLLGEVHTLTYGVEASRDEQQKTADGLVDYVGTSRGDYRKAFAVEGTGKLNHVGVYVQDEMDFDKLKLTLGARYDKYSLGGIFDGDFSHFSPKAKIAYQATDNLTLRAGYGHIFRGPHLGETLMLSEDTEQSEKVNASNGDNVEIGFDYDLSDGLGAERSLLGFTAYRYDLDNYAEPDHNAEMTPEGDAEVWGVETVFTLHKGNFDFNLSHTYINSELKDYETGLKYDNITGNIHTFKLGADYRINDDWALNYYAQFVPGNKYTVKENVGTRRAPEYTTGQVERAGYGVHNIGVTYAPKAIDGLKINLGIDNVFDKKYTRHTAFGTTFGSNNVPYEVGRNYKINFSYKF